MASLDSLSAVLFTGTLLTALCTLWSRQSSRTKLPLPPGPKPLPFIGNALDIPASYQWETYARWAKEYDSDIIHFNMFGQSFVVLCSLKATDALLEKRSARYSNRPDFPMVSDLMGWGFMVGSLKYGEQWRIHRRLINESFNIKDARAYRPHQLSVARTLLACLLDTPEAFEDHFRHLTGELILSALYGIDVQPKNDPYVVLANKALRSFALANVPGRYLVDTFPALKHIPWWFPGAGFKRRAAEWSKLAHAMLEVPFAETKRRLESGLARSSFTSRGLDTLNNREGVYFEERHLKAAAGSMFIGGADTSSAALGFFLMAMLTDPDAQRRAQAEIDALTDGKFLPAFADEDALPYVGAIVKEVLRWQTIKPFALPRLLDVEDEYGGYRIPRGSLVIGNTWAILHDERNYPDPHLFKPERFLLPDGRLDPGALDPQAAFGYGRRLCPGRHFARSTLWIAIASILAVFDISPEEVDGECMGGYVSAWISGPLPFKCKITPRSNEAVELIRATETQRFQGDSG
ncbi:cytochrome P450 [Roridomyces roridus]|uniref:Cytochrome P450 n=1 Tax=Roridomyces roridus TaxID=1738132 RepID=A0AAD7BD50_9AGAR|nr:cytochrome P450 [Roridomyces roridus]